MEEYQNDVGHDSKQILLVDHRASEDLRFTSPEQKSLVMVRQTDEWTDGETGGQTDNRQTDHQNE